MSKQNAARFLDARSIFCIVGALRSAQMKGKNMFWSHDSLDWFRFISIAQFIHSSLHLCHVHLSIVHCQLSYGRETAQRGCDPLADFLEIFANILMHFNYAWPFKVGMAMQKFLSPFRAYLMWPCPFPPPVFELDPFDMDNRKFLQFLHSCKFGRQRGHTF